MTNAVRIIPETQVNTYTTSDQTIPAMAGVTGGGYVVVWQSTGQDAPTYAGIFGQRYNADGTTLGGEFQINTTTANSQAHPAIDDLSDGGFIVTWDSYGQDGQWGGIYAQQYEADGSATGSEFLVNTTTSNSQLFPTVTGLPGTKPGEGGYVVSWMSRGQDGSGDGIFAQRYSAGGGAVGGEFQVNTTTNGDQQYPDIAALTDGTYVAVWQSAGQDGDGTGIYGRIFTGTTGGTEFRVNSHTAGDQDQPAVAGLIGGGFVVTWESADNQDGDGWGIYGQLFMGDGTPVGDEFRVNSHTSGYQMAPDVTALSNGGFVISWTSAGSQDGYGWGSFGQLYNALGAPTGDEFQINTGYSGDQSWPSVAGLSGGGFAAAWDSSFGQDGDGHGIFGQLFTYDHVVFSAGDDTVTLYGPSVNIDALPGNDTVTGADYDRGADTMHGNDGNDTLLGMAGNDTLHGDAGQDNLQGGAGNDILDGGSGQDWLFGGPGDDTYHVDETLDYIDEGVAFPTLPGGGWDTLISTAAWYYESNFTIEELFIAEGALTDGGITTLVGGGNNNIIHGNSGNNNIYANWGNDTVYAGAGTDHIDLSDRPGGATGANTVMFETGNGYDILWNFAPGTDHVDLKPFGLADYAELLTHGFNDGLGNSYFALGATGSDYLYFVGHELADLAAGDFIFS